VKITRTDVIIICLSALFGFAAVAGVSILAAFIAGAPSGALGGIVGCVLLRLRRNCKLYPPFQSPEVREIYAHMTPDEKVAGSRLASLYGLSGSATFVVPVLLAATGHGYTCIIAAAILVTAFVVWIPIWQKMYWKFLCSTAWAQEQGLTPERIQSYAVPNSTADRS
jgi:hypothetical protein